MALLQVNFVSRTLCRSVPMQVILPVDKLTFDGAPVVIPEKFRTLYLLHGLLGDCTDWLCGTRVRRWAEDRNLAVVMPSGENGFYIDNPDTGNAYGRFVGEELVEITRRMFPLSRRREDTFIGGLSMGGYGAIRAGLAYPETFSAVIGLSSALHMPAVLDDDTLREAAHLDYYFGDLKQSEASDKNPRWLVKQLAARGAEMPRFYLACGREDNLFPSNRDFRDALAACGADLTWVEAPGGHEWDFWDAQIHEAVEWLFRSESGE